MKRTKKWLWTAVLFLLFAGTVTVSAASKERISVPVHAAYSGGYLYYAIDNDGGGNLYKYNVSKKTKTTLTKGCCSAITVKGNYVYFCQDNHGGSDATSYAIYRIRKNGTGKKKLADGHSPVIVGNYIYYIAHQKTTYPDSNERIDGAPVGLYRIKLNGTGKKRLYKNSDAYKLAAGSKNIYMYNWQSMGSGLKAKVYNLKTKKVRTESLTSHAMNSSLTYYNSSGVHTCCNVTADGYKYTFSSGKLYRTKGKTKKKIASVSGAIKKVFYTNGYLFVVSEKQTNNYMLKGYAYVMKKDGKGKKLLRSWDLVSGGWDY